MYCIRPAEPQDALAIAEVHVASWRTTYRGIVPDVYLSGMHPDRVAARWRVAISNSELLLVASSTNSKLVGFIVGGVIRSPLPGYDAEVYAMYLLAEAQRHGIGSALLRELAKTLWQRKLRSLSVWVLAANSAQKFYQRMGAVPLSERIMEIGGAPLRALAFGWPDMSCLLSHSDEAEKR
jgi:ribosomal protein S18 acetylase RimI-like enzyme